MIQLNELTRKTRIKKGDYTFDGEADLIKLLPQLTPKFDGNWELILVDPSVKYVHSLSEGYSLPNYVDCYIYMGMAKLEQVLLKHPTLMPKKQKPWEAYMSMIAELQHVIDPNAAKYLWKALSGDVDKLKEALDKLDDDCEEITITVKQVKDVYTASIKPVFASEVVEAFFTKDRGRWTEYSKLVSMLGERYGYYAIRKQVFKWLTEKASYLKNEETTLRSIADVDALFIDYVYMLFYFSADYRELPALMYEWDNRNDKAVERRLYAYLQ